MGRSCFESACDHFEKQKGSAKINWKKRSEKKPITLLAIETGRIDSPPLEVISSIADGLGVLMSDLFSFEGFDDSVDELRAKINDLIQTDDAAVLRKYYRLLLVAQEK